MSPTYADLKTELAPLSAAEARSAATAKPIPALFALAGPCGTALLLIVLLALGCSAAFAALMD